MKLIILCLGVLSLVYEGDCAVTAWTVPVVTGSKDGSSSLTYAEDKAVGALTTLVATGGSNYVISSQPSTSKVALATGGALTLAAGKWFDYETEPTYVFVVLGDDTSGSTGTVTITISITDVTGDANYGSFTPFYRVDDAAVATTTIATISASGGTSTAYTIVSGNTNTDFTYAGATGVLTTANVMARSTTAAYTIVFQAVAAAMTSTALVIICVGTTTQCGGGAAGLQISLAMLLVAIVTSRIK